MPNIQQQKEELLALITAKDQEIDELNKRKKMLEDEKEKQELKVEVARSAVDIYEEGFATKGTPHDRWKKAS